MTILILTPRNLRFQDKYGRTPVMIGKRRTPSVLPLRVLHISIWAIPTIWELGPGEIVYITPESVRP